MRTRVRKRDSIEKWATSGPRRQSQRLASTPRTGSMARQDVEDTDTSDSGDLSPDSADVLYSSDDHDLSDDDKCGAEVEVAAALKSLQSEKVSSQSSSNSHK